MSVSPAAPSSASLVHRSDAARYAPLLVGLLLALPLWYLAHALDFAWAGALFRWEGGQWALKHHPLLEGALHRGGRLASQAAWLCLLLAAATCWRRPAARAWTRPAARLLLATLASTLLVAWLKSVTRMDCPWDLAGFGGTQPFVALFEARPAQWGHPACFPAAHAATGYAWVALYFFFAAVRPAWRHAGLGVGLAAGLAFGLAQQMRGAHFLSHDVASLLLCWLVACAVDAFVPRGAAEGRR